MLTEFQSFGSDANPQSLTVIHLRDGESPTPMDYLAEAHRALCRGARYHKISRAAREAIALTQMASLTAQQAGSWGCRLGQVRKSFLRLKRSALACARLAAPGAGREIDGFIDATDETLRILAA